MTDSSSTETPQSMTLPDWILVFVGRQALQLEAASLQLQAAQEKREDPD